MTLSEAIRHCEEIAEKNDIACRKEFTEGARKTAEKCRDEHRQLADWLKLLKRILESGDCNECAIRKMCNVRPEWGEQVRYNCPMFVKEAT